MNVDWSAIVALLALALSQLPPLYLWFRPRRLEVEVHSRVGITHKVGNPNVAMFVSVRNTGGKELRIRSMQLEVVRDGTMLGLLPAQNYFETTPSKNPILFVPFSLKPGEMWSHATSFLKFFDRNTEKLFRATQSALGVDIREKLAARTPGDNEAVKGDGAMVQVLTNLFGQLFVWSPGEYAVTLTIDAEPGTASFSKKYRFTLFESDSDELRSHVDDYVFGGGITHDVPRHQGILVPLLY